MIDERYEEARRRVMRRYVSRIFFVLHLVFFVLVMALIWMGVARSPDDIIGGLFTTLVWGAFLAAHGVLAFNLLGGLLDRAARRELERMEVHEKPKRRLMELSEDGELIEYNEDDLDMTEGRKRRHA